MSTTYAEINDIMAVTHIKGSSGDRIEMQPIRSINNDRVCWHADGRVTVTHNGQTKLVHNFNWE